MSGNGGTGLLAEVTPNENLYIQALVPITINQTKADETYKNLRAGFAYTVPETVKIKAQYIGKGAGTTKEVKKGDFICYTKTKADVNDGKPQDVAGKDDLLAAAKDGYEIGIKLAEKDVAKADGNTNCDIEAEVDLLAVQNLFLGVGFQYHVVKDGKDSQADAMKIALGASYQINEDLKVSASGAFFTNYDSKVDARFQAGAGVDYNLGDGLGLNADFRYLSKAGYDGEKEDQTDSLAFSAGVVKNVSSNGCIGVAFQGQTNSGTFANNVITGKPNDDGEFKNFTWAIPVVVSVWF